MKRFRDFCARSGLSDVGLGTALVLVALGAGGCQQRYLTNYPPDYREYAYISNGGSNTVTVLDLVNMRQDRVIAVGANPSGLAVNPRRNEVYVVNSGSDTVSVINAETNTVAAAIPVQRQPYSIDVDAAGPPRLCGQLRFQQCIGARPCASPSRLA